MNPWQLSGTLSLNQVGWEAQRQSACLVCMTCARSSSQHWGEGDKVLGFWRDCHREAGPGPAFLKQLFVSWALYSHLMVLCGMSPMDLQYLEMESFHPLDDVSGDNDTLPAVDKTGKRQGAL